MPFEVKIRPVDFNELPRYEPVKTVAKSRFKRLFERQFSSVVKVAVPVPVPVPEKPACGEEQHKKEKEKEGFEEFDPSSVCLAKMVQNFIEDSNERQRCGRNGCNCSNGECVESSDDEFDSCSCFGEPNHCSSFDACETLKSLVPCASVTERNLLADTASIVDKNKITIKKDDFCRKIVIEGLIALGYNASICKSRWEKSPSCPAGDYQYVEVIIEGERLIIDIDFRSEFEIARATKAYRTILQTLPAIFVGKADRLQRIICIVSDAAKQSLKKKGMPFPPWRKPEYVKAKWLSPFTRVAPKLEQVSKLLNTIDSNGGETDVKLEKEASFEKKCVLGVESMGVEIEENGEEVFSMSNSPDKFEKTLAVDQEEPHRSKITKSQVGVKKSGGLACIIEEKP